MNIRTFFVAFNLDIFLKLISNEHILVRNTATWQVFNTDTLSFQDKYITLLATTALSTHKQIYMNKINMQLYTDDHHVLNHIDNISETSFLVSELRLTTLETLTQDIC